MQPEDQNINKLYKHYLFLGSVEVTIANIQKGKKLHWGGLCGGVCSTHLLPKKRPCALDPFLHPLFSDVEDIFINGKFGAYCRSKCFITSWQWQYRRPEDLHVHLLHYHCFKTHWCVVQISNFKVQCTSTVRIIAIDNILGSILLFFEPFK